MSRGDWAPNREHARREPFSGDPVLGGATGDRTPDPHTASVVLSQLSYRPKAAEADTGEALLQARSKLDSENVVIRA